METILTVVKTAAAAVPVMPRQSEHAVDRAHRAANTRADCSAHHSADRTGVATALTRAFLRAADDALRMSEVRDRQQAERDRRRREVGLRWVFVGIADVPFPILPFILFI